MISWQRILLVIFPLAFAASVVSASPTPLASSAASPSPSASTAVAGSVVSSSSTTYTSVKGDSFTSVSEKYGLTVRALKKFNGLKTTHLKPGTILLVPALKTIASTKVRRGFKDVAVVAGGKKLRHRAPVAQPVQDFDVAPSIFASCPPPPATALAGASDEDEFAPAPSAATNPSTDEFPSVAESHRASLLPVPNLPPVVAPPAANSETAPEVPTSITFAHAPPGTPLVSTTDTKRGGLAGALADFFGGSRNPSQSGEWGNRFLVEARNLAGQGICYDGAWRPDGDSHRWEMDCSNTTRYLYQVTAGISLPRTASDQYYYLHLQDKAWDVPMTATGFADTSFLRGNLKPGDLLFWENTYRPERQPPITHVMIFLGTDSRGRWLMAGSQGGRGFYNRRHSGPDVYVFDPTHYSGGYTTWLGLVRHHGRFVAYGRPLEADVKKLSVAAND